MKNIFLLIFTALLAFTGCNSKNQLAESQNPSTENSGVFPGQDKGNPSSEVLDWAKVKIDASGAVFVSKSPLNLDEFTELCARQKKANGGILLFVDSVNNVATPAQAKMISLIADAGVPMKMAMKESEID